MSEDGDQAAPGPHWLRQLDAPPPVDANVVRSDDLDGRVAVVTGGASGIGAGVARHLADHGAHVVVADLDDEAGETLAKEIGGLYVHCDVRKPAESEAAVAAAEEAWGGLDLIHLNAGLTSRTRLDEFDVDSYRYAMSVNLDGVVYGAVAAVPALRRRGGGTIIATASMAGLAPIAFEPFYTASKHAVVGFVRAIGRQLHSQGIRVQAVCPSFVDTPLIAMGRDLLIDAGVELLTVDDVVEGFVAALDSDGPGQCFYVVPGRPPAPFPFLTTLAADDPGAAAPRPGEE